MKIKGEEVPWVPEISESPQVIRHGRLTSSEYATYIFYWAGEPRPDLLDEMLDYLASLGYLDVEAALRTAGSVLAFEELNPARAPIWRQNYPNLYRSIEEAMQMPNEFHAWADFLAVQWFILRRDDLMRQMLDRAGSWGEKDKYTGKMITMYCKQHGPFRFAAERLKIPVVIEAAD